MPRTRLYTATLFCLLFIATDCQSESSVPAQSSQITAVPANAVQLYTVQRGTVSSQVEFDGEATAATDAPLYFRTDGYVKSVFVQIGDEVVRGDILAELEVEGPGSVSAELDLAAAQARLTYAQRENAYAVSQAELALEEAETEFRYVETQQANYISELDYQHDLQMAKLAVDTAEAELEHQKEGVDPELEVQVKRAQTLLTWAQIITPIDGEVAAVSIAPGSSAKRFEPVVIIADVSTMEVRARPLNNVIEKLSEGQEVVISLKANPSRVWSGIISSLPYPFGSDRGSGSESGSSSAVCIQLDDAAQVLDLGDRVRVTATLGKRENVLWLPRDAVRTLQGQDFVFVYDDEQQHRVDIEAGLEGNGRLEILNGVEEGSVVVVPQSP